MPRYAPPGRPASNTFGSAAALTKFLSVYSKPFAMDEVVRQPLTVAEFIARWSHREGGQERANYSLFLTELCDVLAVPHPDPAGASHKFNDYVFERRVERRLADGAVETGRIDLYKRGHFILEAKQSRRRAMRKAAKAGGPPAALRPSPPDHLMVTARRQAERYATALPPDHPCPPFLIVCDVGRVLELYADFSGNGRHYAHFPDAEGFRITLGQLADPGMRCLLRAVWQAPYSLDPARRAADAAGRRCEPVIAGHAAE